MQSHFVTDSGRVIFVTGEVGVGGASIIRIISLAAATGSLLWSRDLTPSQATTFPQMPAVDNGLVHLVREYKSGSTRVARWVALDAVTGNIQKEAVISTAVNTNNACLPLSPPVVGGARVFVAVDCEGYKIVAINIAGESVAWQLSYIPRSGSDEAIAYAASASRLLVAEANGIKALNPATGQTVWSWSGGSVRTAPTAAGDSLWAAAGDAGNWQWRVISIATGQEINRWPMIGAIPEAYPVPAGEVLFFNAGDNSLAFVTGGGVMTNWFEQAVIFDTGEENGDIFLPIIVKNASS